MEEKKTERFRHITSNAALDSVQYNGYRKNHKRR